MNFILKPQLERRRGYKLFLDDRDLLPRAGKTRPAQAPPTPVQAPPTRPRPPLSALPAQATPTQPPPTQPPPTPAQAPAPPRSLPRPRFWSGPAPRWVRAPPMPRSCRALRRPPGELEPLPAPHRGAVGRLPGPGLVQPQLSVGPARGSGVAGSLSPLTLTPPQGGPMPAAGAHAQTHLHHLRGPAARPRAPRAALAAPAPPPGDPAVLEARLRGAEGGPGSGVGGSVA